MKKIILGALAHVDAGKTTLCEALLFKTNTIKNKGRVDHEDSFLDFNTQERDRGITIYNKEARFIYKDKEYIYLDTPGHTELRCESNRSLRVIDVALLIIDASQDLQSDTISIFNNLVNLKIPTIIFLNKTDINYVNINEVISNLKSKLSEDICDLNNIEETVALQDENLLEKYLEGNLEAKFICESIKSLDVFPLISGSALKDEGIDNLLEFIDRYIQLEKDHNDDLNAYVYKITYDNSECLHHLKILGGTLHNKETISGNKINEIRIYSGNKYQQVQEISAGDLCAIRGLNNIEIGTYLPSMINENEDNLNALTYELKSQYDPNEIIGGLNELNEQNPELNIRLSANHIFINLNGDLHKEIITKEIKNRFGIDVAFSDPIIRYKETITKETYGVGHFEPLRHYGEVIVSIKPIDDGIKVRSLVNNSYTGTLINYLEHYHPRGIITNSFLTNIEITIVDYKTHPKHTEGGDLIEAMRRAIRSALIKNESKVLEPYYLINIDTTPDSINLIIPELNNVSSIFSIEENSIMAKVPLVSFNSFILCLRQRLKDKLSYEIISTVYDQTSRQEEIITSIDYDYTRDLRNPAGSIFTSKGTGHYVESQFVEEKMHLNLADYFKDQIENKSIFHNKSSISSEELNRVWNSLYKPRQKYIQKKSKIKKETFDELRPVDLKIKPIIYLIDGYNLLYSIEELKDVSVNNFLMAREKVIDIVSDFKGYVNAEVILVFDAYKQDYSKPQVSKNDVITIVYTKQLETADTYIENMAFKLKDDYKVISVTSDYLEQMKLLHNSSSRLSSREFMIRYQNFKKSNTTQNNIRPNKPLEELKKLLQEE